MNKKSHIVRDTKKMSPEDAARTYYLSMEETGDREGCIRACINRLVEEKELSQSTAQHIAITAWAELRCINQSAYIDLSKSTSHVVMIRTRGEAVYIPISDLLTFATGLNGHDTATVH